jgi:hypothetical protein
MPTAPLYRPPTNITVKSDWNHSYGDLQPTNDAGCTGSDEQGLCSNRSGKKIKPEYHSFFVDPETLQTLRTNQQ